MGRRATGVAINMGSDLVEVYATKWFKTYFNTAKGAAWIAKAWKTAAGKAKILAEMHKNTVITEKPVITEVTVITEESDITEVINTNWFKIHFGLMSA